MKWALCRALGVMLLSLTATNAWGQESADLTTDTIFGIVMEERAGTPDVPVCLCDGETGLPLEKGTYKPLAWGQTQPDELARKMAIVLTDERGRFHFQGVPSGNYRLVAQRWIGPFQGVFAEHGTVIQLMGSADDITVPRPAEHAKAQVALRPPGSGIVQFDQDVGNSDTLLLLSTSPPEFDPVLGLQAMGKPFLKNLVGVNRMPYGKTTVIGVPDRPLYAFFFAPDNSPGYASLRVDPSKSGLVRVPPEPFVAGWSDGRKQPPARLAELAKFLQGHSLSVRQLLEIPQLSSKTAPAYRARMQQLAQELSRQVELPEGKSARVGDLLAVEAYRRLQKD